MCHVTTSFFKSNFKMVKKSSSHIPKDSVGSDTTPQSPLLNFQNLSVVAQLHLNYDFCSVPIMTKYFIQGTTEAARQIRYQKYDQKVLYWAHNSHTLYFETSKTLPIPCSWPTCFFKIAFQCFFSFFSCQKIKLQRSEVLQLGKTA